MPDLEFCSFDVTGCTAQLDETVASNIFFTSINIHMCGVIKLLCNTSLILINQA